MNKLYYSLLTISVIFLTYVIAESYFAGNFELEEVEGARAKGYFSRLFDYEISKPSPLPHAEWEKEWKTINQTIADYQRWAMEDGKISFIESIDLSDLKGKRDRLGEYGY